jgi:mannose-6-phosphate isomerase-like protein (cupin superfamily)
MSRIPTLADDTRTTHAVIDRSSAAHYTWGDGCDGWHLLRSPTLSVIEERMPPGTSEVRHYHRAAQQFFYVLTGALAVEIDGVECSIASGQGISVTAGVPHEVRNASASDATFLIVSCPPSHGDRVPAPRP